MGRLRLPVKRSKTFGFRFAESLDPTAIAIESLFVLETGVNAVGSVNQQTPNGLDGRLVMG